MITKQLNDNNIAIKMLSLTHIKKLNGVIRVLEEFSKLNQLSTSVVKIWFNSRRQREDSAISTTAVTTKDDVIV